MLYITSHDLFFNWKFVPFKFICKDHNKKEKGMEGRGHMLSLLGSNILYLAIVVTTAAMM